jgi:two-component system response regulator HydG
LLVWHLIRARQRALGRAIQAVLPETMDQLTRYDWPGNVRELQNALERAVLVCRGKTAMPEDLPFHVNGSKSPAPLGKSLSDVERVHVRRVLEEAGWNITRAARLLEIDRVTLYNKIKKYGFEKERPEA